MSDINDTTQQQQLDAVAGTLGELRGLLEQAQQHTLDAAARYQDLTNELADLRKDFGELVREQRTLRKRLDERFPPTLNCPKCGGGVQKNWPSCPKCMTKLNQPQP